MNEHRASRVPAGDDVIGARRLAMATAGAALLGAAVVVLLLVLARAGDGGHSGERLHVACTGNHGLAGRRSRAGRCRLLGAQRRRVGEREALRVAARRGAASPPQRNRNTTVGEAES
jgi:hypothetical protein